MEDDLRPNEMDETVLCRSIAADDVTIVHRMDRDKVITCNLSINSILQNSVHQLHFVPATGLCVVHIAAFANALTTIIYLHSQGFDLGQPSIAGVLCAFMIFHLFMQLSMAQKKSLVTFSNTFLNRLNGMAK